MRIGAKRMKSRYELVVLCLAILVAVQSIALAQRPAQEVKRDILQAEEYLNNGKFTSAVALLDVVLKYDSRNVTALALLGRAYLSAKQLQESMRFFKQALVIDEKNPEANLGLSIALLLEGKRQQAKEHAVQAARGDSTRVDALNILGQIAAEENDPDQARQYFEQILAVDSTHYDALTNLGVLYQKAGNESRSLEYLQKAVAAHPNIASAYHNLGLYHGVKGQLHEAIVSLSEAARLDSSGSRSVRTLGIIYLQRGLFGEAIGTFQRALERDFFDIESRVGKALGYWSLREYDNALDEINNIVSMGVRFNRMELFIADIYFKKKEYDKAMEFVKRDEQENPSEAEGHYLLGVLYKLKGEQERANAEFEKVSNIVKRKPGTPMAFSINSLFTDGKK